MEEARRPSYEVRQFSTRPGNVGTFIAVIIVGILDDRSSIPSGGTDFLPERA